MENLSEKIDVIQWVAKNVPVGDLVPFEKNPRKISKEDFANLKRSIAEDGYHQRILTTPDLRVIGGHQRIKALKELGYKTVDILQADRDVPDDQFKRILVRDNMDYGVWEIGGLGELMPIAELDDIGLGSAITHKIGVKIKEGLTDPDAAPPPPKKPKSAHGDVWRLGAHMVMCGDSTKLEEVRRLMVGAEADLFLTDPPYNVAYEGKTAEALTIQNDSMSDTGFRKFLVDSFACANEVMRPGACFYIWHADSEGYNFRGACFDIGWRVRQCLIWAKQTMVMGRQDYHWKHEPCLYGWKEGAAHYWGSDRTQTTILEFDRPSRSTDHPTMKPINLFEYQVINNTHHGAIVLDLFGGSGTTLLACERLGREARIMELDPKYVDVIVRRWEEYTGQKAVKI